MLTLARAWQTVQDWCGNELAFVFIVLLVSFWVTFWGFHGALLLIEHTDAGLERWRIQKQKERLNIYRQRDLWLQIMRATAKNQVVTLLLLPLLYYLLSLRGLVVSLPFPSIGTVGWQIAFFILCEDTLFFWSHYTLHAFDWLYKNVHSVHHQYGQVISVVAPLSHPIESIFGNHLPIWFGPLVVRDKHLLTIAIWIGTNLSHFSSMLTRPGIRTYQTCNAHCGYAIPLIDPRWWLGSVHSGAQSHDYHHQFRCKNYGSFFTIWDRIMGTYREHKHLHVG